MNRPSNFEERLEAIGEYLRSLGSRHFYGTIALRFDSGRLVHISQQESILPENISNQTTQGNQNPGERNESRTDR